MAHISDDSYTEAVDAGTYKNFVHDAAGYGLAQWTYSTRKENLLKFAIAAAFIPDVSQHTENARSGKTFTGEKVKYSLFVHFLLLSGKRKGPG